VSTQYSEVGGRVIKVGEIAQYIDATHQVPIARKLLKHVGNVRLVGETGTGKTHMVYHLSAVEKSPLFEMGLNRNVSSWDLLGTDVLKKGETDFRKGIVTHWLNAEKGILYLDGFNYAEPSVIALLETLADFRGNIWISELEKTFFRSENHKIIISFNPAEKSGYAGTFIQNIATMRRFEGLIVKYLPIKQETDLIMNHYTKSDQYDWCRRWVEFANKTRQLYLSANVRTPITTGNLINYAKLHQDDVDDEDLLEIVLSLYGEMERETITRQFEGTTALKLPEEEEY